MSIEPLHKLADHFRSHLQQKNEQTAQVLTREHARTIQQIKPQLDQMYRDIETKQRSVTTQEEGAKIPLTFLFEGGRLETLKQFVMGMIDNFAQFAKMTVSQVQQWAALLGTQAANLMMKAAQPDSSPDGAQPSILSKFLTGMGNKLSGLFGDMGKNAAKGVQDVLQLGLSLGQKTNEMAEKIEQHLDEPRWRSLTIAATELFKAYNGVVMETYRANRHAVSGWIWHCKLSPHSCAGCVVLHGTVHSLNETLHDHPNGECVPLPYSGQELPQSGLDWFDDQDEAVQRAILGTNVAYDLWKAGTPLPSFLGIDHSHEYGDTVYQRSVRQIKKGR